MTTTGHSIEDTKVSRLTVVAVVFRDDKVFLFLRSISTKIMIKNRPLFKGQTLQQPVVVINVASLCLSSLKKLFEAM